MKISKSIFNNIAGFFLGKTDLEFEQVEDTAFIYIPFGYF